LLVPKIFYKTVVNATYKNIDCCGGGASNVVPLYMSEMRLTRCGFSKIKITFNELKITIFLLILAAPKPINLQHFIRPYLMRNKRLDL
jgi:hypothetical protein